MSTKPEKKELISDLSELVKAIGEKFAELYWGPIRKTIKANPEVLTNFTGFLTCPTSITFYFGRTHFAIEYAGPERVVSLDCEQRYTKIEWQDFTQSDGGLVENILGMDFGSNTGISMPLEGIVENLVHPSNEAFDVLSDSGWNFTAQDMMMSLNAKPPHPTPGSFVRFVNARFFDCDGYGLKSRHIKWIDFIPYKYDDSGEILDSFKFNLSGLEKLREHDLQYQYPLPDGFEYKKLQKVNRFVELIGDSSKRETEITSFLAEEGNKFILSMAFACKDVLAEKECDWQNSDKSSIRPDFILKAPNGETSILELKLPKLKSGAIVGKENREKFSAEIAEYMQITFKTL